MADFQKRGSDHKVMIIDPYMQSISIQEILSCMLYMQNNSRTATVIDNRLGDSCCRNLVINQNVNKRTQGSVSVQSIMRGNFPVMDKIIGFMYLHIAFFYFKCHFKGRFFQSLSESLSETLRI